MNIRGIDHLELFVGDAQQAAYYYSAAFGLEVAGRGGPETGLMDQRSLLMAQGDVRLVLTSGLYAEHTRSPTSSGMATAWRWWRCGSTT